MLCEDQPSCHLNALPPELIDNILIHLDSVRALGNVITTCRCVYQRFTARPGPLILGVLQNELGPVLADAQFLCHLSYANPGSSPEEELAYWDKLHDSAVVYQDILRDGGNVKSSSLAALTQQCHALHQMSFISNVYIAALARWFQTESLHVLPPSRSEWLRVLRAFYRRQIICNAWAPTRREPRWHELDLAAMSNTSGHQGARLGILAPLQPWELQQIDHVNKFVTWLCLSLCLAGDEEGQPLSEANFGEIFAHTDRLVQYMRENPIISDLALSKSPLRLRDRGVLEIAPLYISFADRYALLCLEAPWQRHRFELLPDPVRDQMADERPERNGPGARIEFVGDQVDLVPFGWVDGLDGRYVNWFGEAFITLHPWGEHNVDDMYSHHHSLQKWRRAGFALWDRKRIEAMKQLDLLCELQTGWVMRQS